MVVIVMYCFTISTITIGFMLVNILFCYYCSQLSHMGYVAELDNHQEAYNIKLYSDLCCLMLFELMLYKYCLSQLSY